MSSFVIPAFVAVLVGCGLAVLAFVPFVAISYRRRGGLTLWHAFVWLAAAVYAMALWTYTLLPVPPAGPRLVLGAAAADELIRTDQNVSSARLEASGFTPVHTRLEDALRHVLRR